MAMKQLTKTCPHCGMVAEQRAIGRWGHKLQPEDYWAYGSPLKMCRNCQKLYIDKDYRELAITPLRSYDKAPLTSSTYLLVMTGVILGGVFYLAGQTAIACIAGGVAVMYTIADLAFFPTRLKKLEKEKAASEKRMSDPQYAQALKNSGFDIPDQYLQKQ